jgi:hypothetical protein
MKLYRCAHDRKCTGHNKRRDASHLQESCPAATVAFGDTAAFDFSRHIWRGLPYSQIMVMILNWYDVDVEGGRGSQYGIVKEGDLY